MLSTAGVMEWNGRTGMGIWNGYWNGISAFRGSDWNGYSAYLFRPFSLHILVSRPNISVPYLTASRQRDATETMSSTSNGSEAEA